MAWVQVFDASGALRAKQQWTKTAAESRFRFPNTGPPYTLGRVILATWRGTCPFALPVERHVSTGATVEAIIFAGSGF